MRPYCSSLNVLFLQGVVRGWKCRSCIAATLLCAHQITDGSYRGQYGLDCRAQVNALEKDEVISTTIIHAGLHVKSSMAETNMFFTLLFLFRDL